MNPFSKSGSQQRQDYRTVDPSDVYADQTETMPAGVATGLSAGTKVATSIGWRPVEMVMPGDKVLTFDNGMQVVTGVTRGYLWSDNTPCPEHLLPLYVPAEALGNAQPMLLLPEQSVVVESDVGEEIYGDPFTLLPASALDGFRGIERVRTRGQLEVVSLQFEEDQIVFASAGALFFCAGEASGSIEDLMNGAQGEYLLLNHDDAKFMIGCMKRDDDELAAAKARAA